MLSTMDFVELEVLRMMSAPPAAARLFPSRTIHPRRARGSTCLCQGSGKWRSSQSPLLRVLHCKVSQAADSKYGHGARAGWGSAQPQPAVDRVARAEDRRCLLRRKPYRESDRLRRHSSACTRRARLCLNSCALHVGTEHSATTLAPFAAPAGGLNPGGTHAVAHLPRRDVGSHGNDLAHWLVA